MTYKVLNDVYDVEYIVKKRMVRIITRYKDGKIVMSGPRKLKDKEITKILDQSKSFLQRCKPKTESTTVLHFLGKEYPFNISLSDKNYVLFKDGEINIFVKEKTTDLIKKTVASFYKDEIKKLIDKYFLEVLSYYDLDFVPRVDYSYAKGYLGECFFNKQHVRFSGYLAKCDLNTILQTIHHELCHFYVHSHNHEFKSLLTRNCLLHKISMKNVKKFNDLY